MNDQKQTSNKHRILLALLSVFALVTIGASAFFMRGQFQVNAADTTSAAKTVRVQIAVEGMHCSGCASGIKSMLKRTEGVVSVEVSYENKEAIVEYDTERTTTDKILEVITNLGYKANVKG